MNNYEYLPIIEKFACEMYGIKNCSSTNAARYKKFCSSKYVPEPQQLPPTKDALFCHMKRVNYVTAVVKNSLIETNPIIPCPDGYSWTLNNDILEIVWMLDKPASDEIIELISCSCRKFLANLIDVSAKVILYIVRTCVAVTTLFVKTLKK